MGEDAELQRLIIKPVTVKEQPCLSFVCRYKTRDITQELPGGRRRDGDCQAVAGFVQERSLAGHDTDEAQLEYSKRTKSCCSKSKPQPVREAPRQPSITARSIVSSVTGRPFLFDLGVTDAKHALIPSMSRSGSRSTSSSKCSAMR